MYTINFSGYTDPVAKATKAIDAVKAYLGDLYPRVIESVTRSVKAGEFTSRKHIHFAMSFVGVQGYPVDALIDTYWPDMPAENA